jgi:hypothetical protein
MPYRDQSCGWEKKGSSSFFEKKAAPARREPKNF